MENELNALLVQLSDYVAQHLGSVEIRYTDGVIGMRHRVRAPEIAKGIRALVSAGLTLTPETQPLHELIAARAESEIVLPERVDRVLDAVTAYLALHGGKEPDSLAAFESLANRCLNS